VKSLQWESRPTSPGVDARLDAIRQKRNALQTKKAAIGAQHVKDRKDFDDAFSAVDLTKVRPDINYTTLSDKQITGGPGADYQSPLQETLSEKQIQAIVREELAALIR